MWVCVYVHAHASVCVCVCVQKNAIVCKYANIKKNKALKNDFIDNLIIY